MIRKPTYEELERRIQFLEQTESEHHEEIAALKRDNRRYERLYNSITVAVLVADGDGKIVHCNPAFSELFGYQLGDILGRKSTCIYETQEDTENRARKIKERIDGQDFLIASRYRKKSGKVFDGEETLHPIINDQKGIIGFVASIRDVSERRKREKTLRRRLLALTSPLDHHRRIKFGDLFDIEAVQQIQDQFAEATGVASLISYPDGTPITKPSNFCCLCRDIIRQSDIGLKNCNISDAYIGRPNDEGPIIQPCLSAGLCNAGASIIVGGHHIANWLAGQVRDESQTEEQARQYAQELGVDPEAYIKAFREVPKMSAAQFKKVAEALFTFAKQLSATAYQNVLQARFISELRNAEDELQRERESLSTILENNPHGVAVIDKAGKWLYLNPTFTEITGYTLQDIPTGSEWMQKAYPDPDYRKQVQANWKSDSATAGRGRLSESRITCRDGQSKYVEFITTYLDDRNVLAMTDITQRKIAEKSLQESKLILDNISDVAYIADPEGNVRYFNPAAEKITGRKLEEIIGQQILPLLVENDRQTMTDAFIRTLSGESLELTLSFISGKTCQLTSLPLKDDHGAIIGTFGIARDITEHLLAEKALAESEARLKKAQSVAKIGNLEYDIETKELLGSAQAFKMFGIEKISPVMPTERVMACVPEAERVSQALHDYIREKKPYDIEYDIQQEGTGETIVVHSIAELVYENDKPVKVMAVIRDVTEQKKNQEVQEKLKRQLQMSKKLESIGSLAGGVAHDLNNLLTPIMGYGEMLLMDMDQNDFRKASVEQVLEAAARAKDLVRQLLAFSRKQVLEFKTVDLNKVLKRFDPLLRRTIREDISINVLPGDSIPIILGDIGQLEQVIMNLAVNAQDAMPDGGRMTIETSTVELDETYAADRSGVLPGKYAMLAVSDTGVGLEEEVKERIFEPFFSTKGEGGTGLGLATVYGIVKQHGGNIWVYSELGEGTTFKVYLPASTEAKAEVSNGAEKAAGGRGTETVLLVEDNEQVRAVGYSILKRLGYNVYGATGGNEALKFMEKFGGSVHLLLTDVVMPKMNGKELFERLTARHPDLKVLYMSGYTNNVIAHHGVLDEDTYFIQKPFTFQTLTAKVREVLDK